MVVDSQNVLTIEDLSAYLKISKSSLYKLAQAGKLPGHKVGRHWRFRRETIDRWLDSTQVNLLFEDLSATKPSVERTGVAEKSVRGS